MIEFMRVVDFTPTEVTIKGAFFKRYRVKTYNCSNSVSTLGEFNYLISNDLYSLAGDTITLDAGYLTELSTANIDEDCPDEIIDSPEWVKDSKNDETLEELPDGFQALSLIPRPLDTITLEDKINIKVFDGVNIIFEEDYPFYDYILIRDRFSIEENVELSLPVSRSIAKSYSTTIITNEVIRTSVPTEGSTNSLGLQESISILLSKYLDIFDAITLSEASADTLYIRRRHTDNISPTENVTLTGDNATSINNIRLVEGLSIDRSGVQVL